MAKMHNGIMGAFSGKVGTVIGASWYGIPYMKSLNKKRSAEATGREKQNRDKFATAHAWLHPILKFVREGFKDHSLKSRGFNAAKSYALKNAFEGTLPDITINPALVKVAAGDLPLSGNITAEKTDAETIRFTWDIQIPNGADPDDQVMVLAYCLYEKNPPCLIHGQLRYTGSENLSVDPGKKYHLYLAFNAADRSRRSDSVYLGEIDM
jgi:hypothetical protein